MRGGVLGHAMAWHVMAIRAFFLIEFAACKKGSVCLFLAVYGDDTSKFCGVGLSVQIMKSY